MNEKFYYFDENTEKFFHAGYKARVDVLSICENCEGTPINFFNKPIKSKLNKFLNLFRFLNTIKQLKKGDILFLQSQTPLITKAIAKLNKKGVRTIMLIHDIDGLRSGNKTLLKKELKLFGRCDIIIVHNQKMSEKLISLGLDPDKMIALNVFDYLCRDIKIPTERKDICFAGNLSKSGFLSNLPESLLDYGLRLYGPNVDNREIDKRAKTMGAFPPDVIPDKIADCKYALVWDGNSCDSCEGLIGEYLKFNNPHKLSLYVAAGVPVIVWEKSAIADFVNKNEIGVCINSLKDISDRIKDITDKQYENMIKNVGVIGGNIRSGYYLSKAINSSINKINIT